MSVPIQMTAETLNALKGWPRPNALDFEGQLDPSVNVRVPPGSCCSLNANGFVQLGVGNSVVMPLFNFQASNDPDVLNEAGDPATDKGVWVPINPTGVMMFLVATGSYELVSTNYCDQDNYPPNTPLTSPLVTGAGVNAGQLCAGTMGTNMIVGLVSRGVIDNGYGTEALAFWPVCLPPGA